MILKDNNYIRFVILIILIFFQSCTENHKRNAIISKEIFEKKDSVKDKTFPKKRKKKTYKIDYDTSKWTDIKVVAPKIKVNIKYATKDNFVGEKMYDCGRCLLRPKVAKAIAKANQILLQKGYRLKMWDCYRPRPYQQRLWNKMPNASYVTPPKKGSMHNRGIAVDLTIVDKNGKELDMGTPYDFFGKAAHTDHFDLPENVLKNRTLLRETMESVNFKGIRTEWWHFYYRANLSLYPLDDYVWECETSF